MSHKNLPGTFITEFLDNKKMRKSRTFRSFFSIFHLLINIFNSRSFIKSENKILLTMLKQDRWQNVPQEKEAIWIEILVKKPFLEYWTMSELPIWSLKTIVARLSPSIISVREENTTIYDDQIRYYLKVYIQRSKLVNHINYFANTDVRLRSLKEYWTNGE